MLQRSRWSKAVDSNAISKDEYEINLKSNIANLKERLKSKKYHSTAAKRVNISKANGKIRNLAIANFEDKIIQMAVKKIVEAIYEPKFLNNMFGFRSNKSCHKALRYLDKAICDNYTSWVLDADIKGFFDNIDHNLLMKALKMHIGDNNLLRLIKKFLKVGILEDGKYIEVDEGTTQGSILSPVLANIFIYYTLVLWTEKIKTNFKGFIGLTNHADDFIVCFQYKEEAYLYLELLRKRLKQCKLELAEEKTKLIRFGRFASQNSYNWYKRKPETFTFLGFTHICSKTRYGRFKIYRMTLSKKFKQKLSNFKEWIRASRRAPLENIMDTVKRKLIGHYNYYGITDNSYCIRKYRSKVLYLLCKWLNRRSQRRSYINKSFAQMVKQYKVPYATIKVNFFTIQV